MTNTAKIRVVSDSLGQSVTLKGWNTKNDKLRETARQMVGPTGTVRVRYWRGLDLVSDVIFNVASGGVMVGGESLIGAGAQA